MNTELRAALTAVTFLTRAPLPSGLDFDAGDVRRAGAYFPLVGAAAGALSGAMAQRAGPELGVLGATLVTGALHLDALADVADAAGATTRERALEIMRDPRIGAFGATAIASDLLVRSSALDRLVARRRAIRAAVAAGALSRAAPVVLASALPYARAEGTGAALAGGGGLRAAAAAATSLVLAAAALGGEGARLATVAVTTATGAGLVLRRWLGGVTGDGLGATLALTETTLLVVAARQ